ncbi:hypothetical protein ACWEOE_12720 [Amycolatopsis sp. NPDC004368]
MTRPPRRRTTGTARSTPAPGPTALDLVHVRYRYEVREATTAVLVGTFELDSDGSHTRIDQLCPASIPVGTPGDTVVPDSVPDGAFADALRPYVEAVRP